MRMRILSAFFVLLYLCGASFAEIVTYDGNNIYPFEGRTREDVTAKYLEAKSKSGTYRDNDAATWYEIPASTESPYAAGKLTQDTHNAMSAMTDFYRWLAGTKPVTRYSSHSDSLQYQALDRNFEFAHIIQEDSKPDDMPQDLWDLGFDCTHNILSYGSDPAESVTEWLNEGYLLGSGEWDVGGNRLTLGHRLAIISGYVSSITYGYCGRVGIGAYSGGTNNFEGAFSAFPAPGFNPRRKIHPYESAWHVQLNREYLTAPDEESINITVTDINTGESYTCSRYNGKLGLASTILIPFVQPSGYSSDKYYDSSYRVDITGLKETSTGNDAKITYTVSFMELPPEIRLSSPITLTAGQSIYYGLIAEGRKIDKWEIYDGTPPEGFGIEQNSFGSWWIGGAPKSEGTYTFRIRASNQDGEDISTITINVVDVTPSITTESLTPASADVKYSARISASGSKPLTFSITAGDLPEGLSMDNNGKISGTPTETGTFTFTVYAENTAGNDSKTFTLTVNRIKPSITTESLDDFEVRSYAVYSRIYAEGSKPVIFTLTEGNLPEGLTLSADGTINGTPQKEGQYTFTVTASNNIGNDTRTYTVNAVVAVPEIINSSISEYETGRNFMIYLSASGSKPFSWSVLSGNLPDGMTLSSDDKESMIKGIPTKPGIFTFTLRASNSAGYDDKSLTFVVTGDSEDDSMKPSITTENLDMAVTGTEYSAALTASSDSSVTWTYTGRLPTGLTLDTSGKISGKPTKAGKFTFTATAANSYGKTTKRFTLQVVDPVTIITASLKDATINKNYSVTMKAKGTRPFTWSAENLPDGLSINAKTGRISGKPTATGNFTVKVSAENSAGTVTENFSLNVKDIAPKLAGSLAKATLNEEYSSGLRLTAGTGTITWSITGDLPTGLTFDTSTGIISGTPTSYERSGYKLTITAKNDAGEKSKKVTLMVKGTAPKITTTTLTDATVSKTYTFTLTATGSEPITFTADSLPEGLTLSEDGTISGKPTKSYDAFTIVIYAENPVKKVRKSLKLKINAADDSDTRLPIIRFSDGTSYTALTDEFLPENISGGYVFPLGEVSCDEAGMYDFELELPEYVREGAELVYVANSESPSDDDEIAEIFDENGNEISAVPESRKIIISIWLNEGITYKPVIIVMP